MAQGQFTKEEARATRDAVTEIGKALPKGKRVDFLGHLNDILLFVGAAERAAPPEAGAPKHVTYVTMEAMHVAGLEPHELLADGRLVALPYELLRLAVDPADESGTPTGFVQVYEGQVIAELPFASIVWKVPT